MEFNPLGSFVINAPLNEDALSEARIFVTQLPACSSSDFDHIYLHWTVGGENQNFPDYNASVRYDGTHFHIDVTHDPRDNARSTFKDPGYAAHTWLRNTGGFGIATDNMAGASVHDFGDAGESLVYLEHLCAAAAAVAVKYKIDLSSPTLIRSYPYQSEKPIMTHAEAAMTGGKPLMSGWYDYGITGTCERWDLSSFISVPVNVALTAEMATQCADALRERIKLYKQALLKA